MEHPAWLTAAWAEFGVREADGSGNDARVLGYFRDVGHGDIKSDATPWCAAFAGSVLAKAGLKHTGSLMARSYMRWGVALDEPRPGAIAVLTRGSDPFAGHVGFFVGSAENRIFLLGGNQGNAVGIEAFDASRLLGYRWPDSNAPQAESATAVADGAVKTGADFEAALAHVLEMEGGYSDDPYDPGGPTNKGITLGVLAKWRGVTVDRDIARQDHRGFESHRPRHRRDIYRARYWQPASCALLPDAIAAMHFDAAVNHGVGGAIRLLQAALAVAADGEIGPETLQAARSQPLRSVIGALRGAAPRPIPRASTFLAFRARLVASC